MSAKAPEYEALKEQIEDEIAKKLHRTPEISDAQLIKYIEAMIMNPALWKLIDQDRNEFANLVQQGKLKTIQEALVPKKPSSSTTYVADNIEPEYQAPTKVRGAHPSATLNKDRKVGPKPPYFEED